MSKLITPLSLRLSRAELPDIRNTRRTQGNRADLYISQRRSKYTRNEGCCFLINISVTDNLN